MTIRTGSVKEEVDKKEPKKKSIWSTVIFVSIIIVIIIGGLYISYGKPDFMLDKEETRIICNVRNSIGDIDELSWKLDSTFEKELADDLEKDLIEARLLLCELNKDIKHGHYTDYEELETRYNLIMSDLLLSSFGKTLKHSFDDYYE